MTSYAFLVFSVALLSWIVARGIREHRDAVALRHRLLDEATDVVDDAKPTIAPDQFPIVSGHIDDGRRIKIELIADTMVTRRLPQLWLRITLLETIERGGPTVGALARPTGAEYYSLVHGLPEWMAPPETGTSMLMRGDGRATALEAARLRASFQQLFADPLVKEIVVTPRATRLMVQASEGERAAHLFLRQTRFPLATVPADTIRSAVAMAEYVSTLLTESERADTHQAA